MKIHFEDNIHWQSVPLIEPFVEIDDHLVDRIGIDLQFDFESQTLIPYTNLDLLREQRLEECFPIINRGQLWYNTLTETQKVELNTWYDAWLNVTETKIIPEKLDWLK